MKHIAMVCAALCLGSTSMSAQAAEQPEKDERVEMEQIGVKGKRDILPVYSPVAVTESSRIATEIIDSEEIRDLNPVDFYDMISRAAGMTESFQGRKVMNFMTVRRGGGLNLIIDGLYIPSNQASRVLAQFPMDAIESVRVIRDSTSLSLGPVKAFASYASAPNEGCIVVTTKKGYRPEGGLVAEYGYLDTREFQLYHGNKIGNFDYRLTGTASGTNGRSGQYAENKSMSLLLNTGYDGPKLKVNSMLFYNNGMRHFQIADGTSPTATTIPHWGYDPLEGLWFSFNANMLWTPDQITSVTYGHGLVEDTEWQDTYNGTTQKETYKSSHQRDSSDNYHLWHTAVFGDNTVKAGAQMVWWHEPTGYASYDGKEREETLIGGYIQDEHKFMGGRLTLDGGIRVDTDYMKTGVDKYSPTQGTNKVMKNEWTKPVYEASIGTAYKLDDIHTLNARFGFTHANLDPYLATVNNKDLPAEERFKYELGVAAKYHPAFNPAVTLFYYDIKDSKIISSLSPIVVTPTYSYNVYDSFNEGQWGGEASVSGSVPYGFNYKINYAHKESTVSANNGTLRDSASFLVGHTYGPLKTNVSMRYVAAYDQNSSTPHGNFLKLDANVSYNYQLEKLSGRIMIYGRNLMNDRYKTSQNYADVGTTFGVRLEAGF